MAIPGHVQRFSPRHRDIAVENKTTTAGGKPDQTKTSTPLGKDTDIEKKQKNLSPIHQLHTLLMILIVYAIIYSLKNERKKKPKKFVSSFNRNFDSMETVVNMLSDVSPYLGLQEQEKIQTLIGMFEAANILSSIRNGSYQSPRILKSLSTPMDSQERKLGIIKALKPYLPPSNYEIIDKAIHTYNAIDRVSKNLVHNSSQSTENAESQNIANKITELLEIIDPLVPNEQQQKFNQVKNLVKMYNAMEESQLWEKWTQQEAQQEAKKSKTQNPSDDEEIDSNKTNMMSKSNNDDSKTNNDKPTSNSREAKKSVTDALKSVLNPEQIQTMEVMMKMAQLLSQKSDDKEDKDDD